MNIILFGPPGAGKGTQAKYLVEQLKSFQISTGDMLRDEIQKNSEIGKKIVEDMSDGKFVSDEIVNSLIEKVIFDPDKKNKLIFDGYPRSLTQAKNLDKLLEKTNQKIISIDNYFSGSKKNHILHKNVKYIKGENLDISKLLKKYKRKIKIVFHFGEFSRIFKSFKRYVRIRWRRC